MYLRRFLLAGSLAALVLAAFASSATAAAPKADATLTLTKPLNIMKLSKQTPIPEGGTSYYCAVGVFVPFNDLAGWTPVTATYTYFGTATSLTIGDPPYSDAAAINGLVFTPVGGQHHVQIGDASYSQGGVLGDDCAGMVDRVKAMFAATATVTYEHTPICSTSITKLLKARTAVAKATKRRADAKTDRAKVAATKALKKAKANRTKATTAFRTNCR